MAGTEGRVVTDDCISHGWLTITIPSLSPAPLPPPRGASVVAVA